MKKALFLLLVGLFTITCYSQLKFQKVYGGDGAFEGQSVVATKDSGYVILGHTTKTSTTKSIVFLMKINKNGDVQWSKTYAVLANDVVRYFALTQDSGFVISGYATDQFGTVSPLLMKTTSTGDLQWSRILYNSSSAYIFCAQQLQNGGYILAGYGQSSGNGLDGTLIKTDSVGSILWQKFYGNAMTDAFDYVCELPDGSLIASGWTFNAELGTNDSWLLKADGNGNIQWSKAYGGPTDDGLQVVIPSVSGGFLAGGNTHSVGGGKISLLKTNSSGDLLWSKAYGGFNVEAAAASMVEDKNGSFAVIGQTSSFGPSGNNIFFLKADSLGSVLAFRVYGGTGSEDGRAIRKTLDNGYVLVGWSESFAGKGHDVYVIKTDSVGRSGCNDTTASPAVTTLWPTPSYHGVATFQRRDSVAKQDTVSLLGTTLCSSAVLAVTGGESMNDVPRQMDMSQNFPNPFNPSTSLNIDVPIGGFVRVLIFNEIGQLVDRLVQTELGPGRHRVEWTPRNISSGTYFYQLEVNGKATMPKKMLLLK